MSGLGSSIYCQLPSQITDVLQGDNDAAPVATRLACTIGPQSCSVEVLAKMLQAGMKIARFDFTYGDLDFHLQSYKNLKAAMKQTSLLCAVMINPPGPDVDVINRPSEPIKLEAGQTVKLLSQSASAGVTASSATLPTSLPGSWADNGLAVGGSVFVAQYLFSGAETSSAYLTVQAVEADAVTCVVNNSCTLEGLQLTVKFSPPASAFSAAAADASSTRAPGLPCLGPADEALLAKWAAAVATVDAAAGTEAAGESAPAAAAAGGGGDFVALSRTRNAADVAMCREMLARVGLGHLKVVAKLEDLEGLTAHQELLAAADALIFSRGSLGTCLEAEKVFLAQKMVLHAANSQGKPVFVTRVVDTMTDAPRPTRAEATDMANLVLDGADGVLLGSETFRGKYPVDAVRTVAAICRAAEGVFDNYAFYRSLMDAPSAPVDRAEALASSAVRAAHKMAAKLLVVFTVTGRSARLLAKYKPSQPILTVVCTDPNAAQFAPRDANASSPQQQQQQDGEPGMKKVGSDTLLSLQHLAHWNHGAGARACLMYRGAVPVMVDAPEGCKGGNLLDFVLDYAKSVGLVVSGDRVVVSQCPRIINSEVLSEAGVVQLVTVDQDLP